MCKNIIDEFLSKCEVHDGSDINSVITKIPLDKNYNELCKCFIGDKLLDKVCSIDYDAIADNFRLTSVDELTDKMIISTLDDFLLYYEDAEITDDLINNINTYPNLLFMLRLILPYYVFDLYSIYENEYILDLMSKVNIKYQDYASPYVDGGLVDSISKDISIVSDGYLKLRMKSILRK